MSKTVKVLIALVVALAVATPAMAAFKLNGYYRLQGDATSLNRSANSESNTNTMFDNRLRLKMNYTLNDYISVVYYMEVDTPWGEQSKGSNGGGGKLGADGVNVETKNAFVDFKIPDTSWKLRTGIQGGGIGAPYESLVEHDDMAGAKLSGKIANVNTTFLYSKWDEGVRADWDDVDYYAIDANTMATEALKIGGSVAWIDANNVQVDDYYFGLYSDFKIGDAGSVGGFFLYRDYSNDIAGGTGIGDEDDGNAMVLDVKGRMNLSNGFVKVHAAYFNDDDDAKSMDTFSPAAGGFEYHKDSLMLFLTDVYYNNAGHTAVALSDAAYAGYGLWFLTVSGKVDLPQDYYLRYGAGYFSALEDSRNDEATASKEDEDLGVEVAARIGKVFAEKYDVSLRGAYGFLGGFYDAPAGSSDPDDIYKVVGMVNVSF